MNLKHKEKFNPKKVKLISFISFLMGFLQALFIYVMSYYFKEASGTENVGPFYFFSYILLLVIFLNLHKLVKVFGKVFIFHIALILKVLALALLVILPPTTASIAALMLYIVSGSIEWVALDIILESHSIDNLSGRIRGKFLTLVNAGYLFGPLISAYLLNNFGYVGIFFVLLLSNAVLLAIALFGFGAEKESFKEKVTVRGLLRKIILRKNVRRIYYISFILEFFYALVVIYTPIYLKDLGVSWGEIGIIFTLMLVPFVLLQYPLGVLADKKTGEKKLIILAIGILAFFTVAIGFVSSVKIWPWAVVLFGTRIGAAILEIMRDSYFYKRIDSCDVDVINFFRTAQSFAFITATSVSFLIFRFFPGNHTIRIIFFVVAAVLLSGIFPAWGLSNNPPEKKCIKKNVSS